MSCDLKPRSVRSLIILIILIVVVLGISLFIVKKYTNNNIFLPPQSPTLVPRRTDERGCLIDVGYTWCEVKNKCLRPQEEYCTSTKPKNALFTCDSSKTINANFYIGDDKFVDLVLSDNRKVSVPRAISASGARYANADESFVFWNKGNTAFITENNQLTFENCVTETQ